MFSMRYLEGKPAAEMRMVSRRPHARSCCVTFRGSKLGQRSKQQRFQENDFINLTKSHILLTQTEPCDRWA